MANEGSQREPGGEPLEIEAELRELDRQVAEALQADDVPAGLTGRLVEASSPWLAAGESQEMSVEERRLLFRDRTLDPEHEGPSMLPARSLSGRLAILAMAAAVLFAVGLTLKFSPQIRKGPPPPGPAPEQIVQDEIRRIERQEALSEYAVADNFEAEFAAETATMDERLASVELALLTSADEWAFDAATEYQPSVLSSSEAINSF